jgi:hypothetical protein
MKAKTTMKATTKIIIVLTYSFYVSILVLFFYLCVTNGDKKQTVIPEETIEYEKPVTITDSNRIDYDWVNDNELHVNKRSVYDYMINDK